MPEEPRKPTIDERLEAIVQSLELLAHEQEALRRREEKAREALLAGISAYLRALQGE